MPFQVVASSTEPCVASGATDAVDSHVWFKTKPLDRVFCNRVAQLQLYTDSHDQGFISDQSSGTWSWFEVAIYEDENATEPIVRDEKEFVWRSHTNRLDSQDDLTEDSRQYGIVFDRRAEILDALRPGNVIAVRVCACFPGWKNFATKGELVANVLDTDLFSTMSWTVASLATPDIPVTIKQGLYTLISTTECYVKSEDNMIASKIWFTTPIIDKQVKDKIQDLRLYTVGHEQDYVDDPTAGNWSWYDLAILETPDSTEPKVKDGRALVWRSHENNLGEEDPSEREGPIFDRHHELLSGLEVGNVIAVCVCTRFAGWENHGHDARLVVRIANDRLERDTPAPLFDAAAVLEKDRVIVEEIEKQGIPLATNDLLTPLRADEDSKASESPLRLLSLDGGGVRGISSLYILKDIMQEVAGDKDAKPCDYFDLICGTSTGGLIAIMLGRLRLTVDQCISAYMDMAQRIFGLPGWGPRLLFAAASSAWTGSQYDASKLEASIREIVKKQLPSEGGEATMHDPSPDPCKIIVVSCHKNNLNNTLPACFRSYVDNTLPRPEDSLSSFKIWEAARATSAAPTYFSSIDVGGEHYVDGGLQFNNPIMLMLMEAKRHFGRARPLGCIVSIGTGMQPNVEISASATGNIIKNGKALASSVEALLNLATQCQQAHLLAQGWVDDASIYYRFNFGIETGDGNWEKKNIDLADWKNMVAFAKLTTAWLKGQTAQLQACAARLMHK